MSAEASLTVLTVQREEPAIASLECVSAEEKTVSINIVMPIVEAHRRVFRFQQAIQS